MKTVSKLSVFALPISVGALINMLSSFIATYMLAALGKPALAAGALAVSTYIPIMTITSTIFYAIGILISHGRGQGKELTSIGEIVKNGFWLAFFAWLPASLLLWHMDAWLLWVKQNPTLVTLTRPYFHYGAFSLLPTLLNAVIAQFFIGIGKPKFTFWISLITLPAMTLLSYGLILGHFGLPALGLGGITAATMIIQTLLCCLMFVYLAKYPHFKPYGLWLSGIQPSFRLCKTIFSLGFPIGLQFGGELAAMAVATYFMGYFGVGALAASQVSSQYAMLLVMIMLGLTQALSLQVSEAYGHRRMDSIREYLQAALFLLLCCVGLSLLLFVSLPNLLIQIFIPVHAAANANIVHLAATLLTIVAFFLLIDGTRNLFSGTLRGLQDSKTPMWIGLICLWAVSLPVSYLFGFTLGGGPVGLRIGFISGFLLAAILLWRRIQRRLYQLKQATDQPLVPVESQAA